MGSYEEGYKGYSVVSLPSKMRDKRKEVPSGLLEDVATCFIVFTHSCVEKMTSLPFPVGTIIEAVEELAVPLAHPLEGFTLRFLAAVDNQIYAVGTSVEGCILCLQRRGLIGMSADLWVQHEASVREKMQTIIDLANKIPLIGHITPFVCAISAPLGNAVSDWLVEHSQSQVKTIQFHDKEIKKGKEGLDELKEKPGNWHTRAMEIVEAKDVKEEEIKQTDMTLKKDVGGATAGEAKTGAQELKVDKLTPDDKENDAKDVSAVLELIDSGWHLGSAGAISPKVSAAAALKMSAVAAPKTSTAAAPKTSATAAPRTSSNPKKPANSKSRRGILKQ